ncbi:MAG: AMP-binding protein, partial [Alphaproteobacteria bacterium]
MDILSFWRDLFDGTHPWEKSYPTGVEWLLEPIDQPMHGLLDAAAYQHPKRIFLNFLGRTWTYQQVADSARTIAAALQAHGLQQGQRVGLCLPNCPYYPMFYFGILQAGGVVVNLNPLLTVAELQHMVADSEPMAVVTLDAPVLLKKTQQAMGEKPLIVCSLGAALPPVKKTLLWLKNLPSSLMGTLRPQDIPARELLESTAALHPVNINPRDDVALIQYTGGTTGLPKGAMLTHTNLRTQTEQLKLWLGSTDPQGEKILAVLPFFHTFALAANLHLAVATGSQIVMLPRFDLRQVLTTIHKLKPTILAAVPALLNAILNEPKLKKYNLSSLTWSISG